MENLKKVRTTELSGKEAVLQRLRRKAKDKEKQEKNDKKQDAEDAAKAEVCLLSPFFSTPYCRLERCALARRPSCAIITSCEWRPVFHFAHVTGCIRGAHAGRDKGGQEE
jgi:hypothetical protein